MNTLRKQIVNQIKVQKKLQSLVAQNFQSVQKLNSIPAVPQFRNFYSQKVSYKFCQEKEQQQQKQEQKEEGEKKEESVEKQAEKLPEKLNELLQLGTPEAIARAKQIHKELDDAHYKLQQDIKKMKEEREQIQKASENFEKKVNELRNSLKVQIEDGELARVRLTKEKEDQKIYSISKFAKELLETCDNLERAIDNSKENKNFDVLLEGTQMTYDILMKTLKKFGVEQINPFKEKFDPNFHDALMQVEDPNLEPGTVAFVIQSGFTIGDRNLRPAKVGVVKKSE